MGCMGNPCSYLSKTLAMSRKCEEFIQSGIARTAVTRRQFSLSLLATATVASSPALSLEGAAADEMPSEAVSAPDKAWNRAYLVRPPGSVKRPGVLIMHDNRGLNRYFRNVAKRLAAEGFIAMAPNFVPVSPPTEEDSREARDELLRMPTPQIITKLDVCAQFLSRHPMCTGEVAALGFVWGGSFVADLILTSATLRTAVLYYTPPPKPSDAPKIRMPVLLHFVSNDERTAPYVFPFENKMIGLGKEFEHYIYDGVVPGFDQETNNKIYDKIASDVAFERTVQFLRRHLSRERKSG